MKIGLIGHDCRFYLSSRTQSVINIPSTFYNQSHPGLSGMLLLVTFPKPTGKPYEQSGTLMKQPGVGRVWLYSFVVLNNDLRCEFAFISVSFEPWMAHNLGLVQP